MERKTGSKTNAPNGIRIHVTALKGPRPRPLDDGGTLLKYSRETDGLTTLTRRRAYHETAAHNIPLPRWERLSEGEFTPSL